MKIKVGLVDDHQLFLKSLSLMLETLGNYEVVVEALNGLDLQKKMLLVKELPDIILLDVDMPVMNGSETATWLQSTYPAIKLIALSMSDKDNSVIKMFKAGCCSYLLKEVHPTTLEKALQEVHTCGYYNLDLEQFNPGKLLMKTQKEILLSLSKKEIEFLKLACSDLTYKEIANKMFVSERTVDGYRESLFQKIGAKNRVSLCLEALRRGLVEL